MKKSSGRETLILTNSDVKSIVSMEEVISIVEAAFKEKGEGKVQMPPKPYVFFPAYNGDFRVMPAYLEGSNIAGVKIVNAHWDNRSKYSLPNVMATITLIEPATGFPLAIIEGAWITAMRTGAAGAVAAKYLSRKDSRSVGIVGAGVQARFQLMALSHVRNITSVKVTDISEAAAKSFAKEMTDSLHIDIKTFSSVEETVRDADIVVTVTPSRKPIVMREWLKKGVHINAIGADAPGKQELDPEILREAKIVIDDWEQALHGGEINVPYEKGIITKEKIYGEIADIVTARKPSRTSSEETTVFDSTGLAIQDVATAWVIYRRAEEKNLGQTIKLF